MAAEIRDGTSPCDKLLILRVNTKGGAEYNTGFSACNMQASEMLALLEVAKVLVLETMGYINTEA